MTDATPDRTAWLEELPEAFVHRVVPPLRYETHVDAAAHARKLVGLDAHGHRCYLRHTHTRTEDRFDADEWPEEVAVLRERRFAWRLPDGRWLRLIERMDRLESCRPRLLRQGPEFCDLAGTEA